jgi:hypothetical protein
VLNLKFVNNVLSRKLVRKSLKKCWGWSSQFGRIKARINGAGLKNELRNGIWTGCATTTTYLSNMTFTMSGEKYPFEMLFGSKPKLNLNLKIYCDLGVVIIKEKIQVKLKKAGAVRMLV